MTVFTWDTFLKPQTSGDKNIKVMDVTGLIKYTINPYSVVNAYVSGNLLKVGLKSGKTITIPFSSLNESKLALPRIKSLIDNLKQSAPVFVDDTIKNYVQSANTQFFSGTTASEVGTREGALWYDSEGDRLLVYAKDNNGELNWVEPSSKSSVPQFFYQSNQPASTGTNLINVGSFWYDTSDGTLYLYVQDSITKQFTWISAANTQSLNQFFYQDSQPTGTGTNTINIGSFWYDTTDGIFYVYVKDTESGNYFWVTASTSFSTGNLFEFFYQSDQPEGTGTGEIPVGSLWYDTEDGTLFVYVRNINSSGYAWVTSYGAIGPEGPMGATGPAGPTTEGTNGTSGIDGTSGTSGSSGSSGTSGISGSSGTSGTDGASGTSGTSGTDGASGTSGTDGTSGTSGINGFLSYEIPDSSISTWIKLGNWSTAQNGSTLLMTIVAHNGYNAGLNQNQLTELYFATSNGISNNDGFYANGAASRNSILGTNSSAPETIRVVQVSTTSYDFWGYFDQWTGGSNYSIQINSTTSWTNISATGSTPSGTYLDITPQEISSSGTGTSGSSGTSGTSGTSGLSGVDGTDGTSGTSGTTPTTSLSLSENLTVTGTSSFNGLTVLQEVTEIINSTPGATSSTVVYDFTTGSNWYHSSANTNYTANFTNIPTTDNRAITVTIVINQGSTAYIPTAVQIDGSSQTIKWAGGDAYGNANQVDIIGFTFIRSGGDWAQVLGQINTFD